jgi:hypothetical protein
MGVADLLTARLGWPRAFPGATVVLAEAYRHPRFLLTEAPIHPSASLDCNTFCSKPTEEWLKSGRTWRLVGAPSRLTQRHVADSEDAVSDVYLAFCQKPPSPQTPAQFHRWLRSELRNPQAAGLRQPFRGAQDGVVESLDALQSRTR